MKQIQDKPDAIIINFPKSFMEEFGEQEVAERLMGVVKDPNGMWINSISSIPKIEVIYCYISWLGKIQYRMNVAAFEKKATKRFGDFGTVRTFHKKNWVILTGPLIKAPSEIPHRGGQGFRYSKFLF